MRILSILQFSILLTPICATDFGESALEDKYLSPETTTTPFANFISARTANRIQRKNQRYDTNEKVDSCESPYNAMGGECSDEEVLKSRRKISSFSTAEGYNSQNFPSEINHLRNDGPSKGSTTRVSALNPAAHEFVMHDPEHAPLETYFDAGLNQLSNYSPSTIFIPAPFMFKPAAGFTMYDTERAQLREFFLKMEQQWLKQKQLFKERTEHWDSATRYDVDVQSALSTIEIITEQIRIQMPNNNYLVPNAKHTGK